MSCAFAYQGLNRLRVPEGARLSFLMRFKREVAGQLP